MHIADLPLLSSISDVERDTGLAKETLRVWERRYDFPQPQRNLSGERYYCEEQVDKLRLVKRLLDLGFRPGKIMQYSSEQLQALAERSTCAPEGAAPRPHPSLLWYFNLCKAHQIASLRPALLQALQTMGLRDFILDLVAPLTGLVDTAWANGGLALHEEHLYNENLQMVLRHAIFSRTPPAGGAAPRILLTTLPQERHGLGLLMAEALCVAEGAHTTSLGLHTPLPEIVAAARSQHADIVALWFSPSMNARQSIASLLDLRARLPHAVDIWANGHCQAFKKRALAFLHPLDLSQVQSALLRWRREHLVAPMLSSK